MSQKITRHPGWRTSLCDYLASVSHEQFRPGVHDCALFAAGAVQAMTGVNLAADYVGRYSNIPDGMKLLRKEGVRDLSSLVSRHFQEISPLMAGVGDLALVEGEGGLEALGVVQGPTIFVLERNGLGRVPLQAGNKGFRV